MNKSGSEDTGGILWKINNLLERVKNLEYRAAGYLFFLINTASTDIAGYKQLSESHSVAAKTNVSATIATAGQLIEEWATEAGVPGADYLPVGIANVALHAAKTAGTKTVQLFARIYKRDAGGTETLIAETELTPTIAATETHYNIHGDVTEMDIDAADRLVIKVYGTPGGVGGNPTVAVYIQGGAHSYFSLNLLK